MLSLHQLRLLPGDLRARLAHGGGRGARLRPAVGLRADPGPGEVARRRRSSAGSAAAWSPPRSPTRCARTPSGPLAAAEEARRAVQSVMALETGTIRFGMFGTARLYAGAGLVADVLARHPGRPGRADRPELHRRPGRAAPRPARGGDDRRADGEQRGHAGHPGRPRRAGLHQRRPRAARSRRSPPTGCRVASLVMPETTWRADDSTRIVLRQMLHETGRNPQTRIEVEDVETAVELVGMGLPTRSSRAAPPSSCSPGWRRTPAGCRCAPASSTRSRSCTGPAPRSPPPPG